MQGREGVSGSVNDRVVSFDDEPLILVDENDQVLGYENKQKAHDGRGLLHRAFSIFVFNDRNELLLHQRSAEKRLWGGFWTNSCCSHPRRGETDPGAAARRIGEELGITPALQYLFKFVYHAAFEQDGALLGSEHELCSVYAARHNGPPVVNVHEIADWKWVAAPALDEALRSQPALYSPWLKLEWPRIRADHWSTVTGLR